METSKLEVDSVLEKVSHSETLQASQEDSPESPAYVKAGLSEPQQCSSPTTSTTHRQSTASGNTSGSPRTPPAYPLGPFNTPDDLRFSQFIEQQFLQDFERRNKQQLASASTPFNIEDITNNPALAQAAWREMSLGPTQSLGGQTPSETTAELQASASMSTPRANTRTKCARELERDKCSVAASQSEAQTESKINNDMAQLMLSRLTAGRESLEATHHFALEMANAEGAMAKALLANRNAALASESDGPALFRIHCTVAVIPSSLAAMHSQREEELKRAVEDLAEVVAMFVSSRETLIRGIEAVAIMMRDAHEGLRHALAQHEAACWEVDDKEQKKLDGHTIWGPDIDPWATQAALVAAQYRLMKCQQAERGLVNKAYEQVERLESKRMQCWESFVAVLLAVYESSGCSCETAAKDMTAAAAKELEALAPLKQLRMLAEKVQWDGPVQPMARAAEASRQTVEQMHVQGEDTAMTICHDLFSSLEIIRQGPMERWEPEEGAWRPIHCILTRCGFLHSCLSTDVAQCVPIESLALKDHGFDGVSTGVFNLARSRPMSWFVGRAAKRAFRAPSEEIAFDWIVEVKDQIAIWGGNGGERRLQSPRTNIS